MNPDDPATEEITTTRISDDQEHQRRQTHRPAAVGAEGQEAFAVTPHEDGGFIIWWKSKKNARGQR